jgi:hypothetical protein
MAESARAKKTIKEILLLDYLSGRFPVARNLFEFDG